jgi:tRNA(adenine34) deaminase
MPTPEDADLEYMKRCLELAQQAREAGETAVGSLLVRDGSIVGEGAEATRGRLDPAAHAELEAIRAACLQLKSMDLSDCTLYSTVEPCLLCGYAIRATGIQRVVVGTSAGEVGAIRSSHAFLSDASFLKWGHPPSVTTGVLEVEARALLEK